MGEGDRDRLPPGDAPADGKPMHDKQQENTEKVGSVKQSRKRTKTGCLTCRKRRIKCGEERPTCANCRKSKRNCEGYNQRVIFKEPTSAARPPVPIASYNASKTGNAPLNIAPKPPPQPPHVVRSPMDGYPRNATFVPSQPFPTPSGSRAQNTPISPLNPPRRQQAAPFNAGVVKMEPNHLQSPPLENFFLHSPPSDPNLNNMFEGMPDMLSPYQNISWQHYDSPQASPGIKTEPSPIVMDMNGMQQPGMSDMHMDEDHSTETASDDEDTESETVVPSTTSDDYREMTLTQNYLKIVSAQQMPHDSHPRSFTSALNDSNVLANYQASLKSSPLTDRKTAQIFYHFITVTGPSMSQFERNPVNVSWIFQGQPIPAMQQHIWTYTMPALALANVALLHAMLALASLHIAKLQNAPISESLKHYHISLRRIAKSVGLPARRGKPEILAACMLLGYYEVWSADHQKWSNHLSGAKQLIEEIDFANITRYIKRMKRQGRNPYRRPSIYEGMETGLPGDFDGGFDDMLPGGEVDENLVSAIMGKQVNYDHYGSVSENFHDPLQQKHYTRRDLEVYETQRDLFWWYCKQDAYQSLLGGGKLFMDYRRWSHCPPRAPVGRFEATYGTYDHLILLLGRLCDFASRDIKRKRKARRMNDGREDVFMGDPDVTPKARRKPRSTPNMRAASSNDPFLRRSPDVSGHAHMSAGIMPSLGGASKLPMGFTPSRAESPASVESEEIETDIVNAEEEWKAILQAFLVLQDNFGPDFQPLGPEYAVPMATPFGTALNYRSFPIACIWLNFYMGLIILHRVHPSMPPFAMQASALAAKDTARFANEIGRIACAIAPGISDLPGVSPMIGAALIESAFCIFYAGIQYQDYDQRVWTINHLHGIARLVGWESADAIAAGLEKSWARAAETGAGAPWIISTEPKTIPRLDPEILVPDRRRVDKVMSNNPERRLVVARTDRAHYALGILGVQEDFEKLDLGND